MSHGRIRAIVYSCSFRDYDYTIGPLERTHSCEFLRFGDSLRDRFGVWCHELVPDALRGDSQLLMNRRMKLFPERFLPDCDVAIYVDGNILIRADLSPLIVEFMESGADIALFRHPSGRTLNQEIDHALVYRIPSEDFQVTEEQRKRYASMGLLEAQISENSVIFYRMGSSKIARLGEAWWGELDRYSKRDQISLPYALQQSMASVYFWDWHFHSPSSKNLYFARYRHRRTGFLNQLRDRPHVLQEYSVRHRLIMESMKFAGSLRRMFSRN